MASVCAHLEHSWFDHGVKTPLTPLREPYTDLEELFDNMDISGNTSCYKTLREPNTIIEEPFANIAITNPSHGRPLREPHAVLEGLLANIIISGNPSRDIAFLSGLWNCVNKSRPTTDATKSPSFSKFTALPPEIRLNIWQLALPSRTIHVSNMAPERTCWNRRLPVPAPALACREAWFAIRPLMHEVFDGSKYFYWKWPVRRASWVTSKDTLIIGSLPDDWIVGPCMLYKPALPIFENVAIRLEDLNSHVEHLQLLGCIKIIIQTVQILIPVGERTTGKFEKTKDPRKRFRNSVNVVDVENCSDWHASRDRNSYARRYPFISHQAGTHFVCEASLSDRSRIEELLSLASANDSVGWRNGQERLDGIMNWDRAFCIDCLTKWWERSGRSFTETAIINMRPKEPLIPEQRGEAVYELQKVHAGMPRIIPAIRFLVLFQDVSPPGITLEDAMHQVEVYNSDACGSSSVDLELDEDL